MDEEIEQGASWSDLIAESMLTVNDLRLDAELADNPALFFRKMSFYLKQAVPCFNRPPEIKDWLAYTEPSFADYSVTAASTETTQTFASGKTGFDLVSAGVLHKDVYGNPVYMKAAVSEYDSETGSVTVDFTGIEFEAGETISIDFYKDGTFKYILTAEQRKILIDCIQYVWETAFVNDWLNRAPRVKDKSFDAGNVANQTRVNTERITFIKKKLDDEIFAYEQKCEYENFFHRPGRMKMPY